MVLNNSSYLHKKIRKLCEQLEFLSGLKMITDLNDYFVEVRLMNKYGYIIIDWRKNAIFTLSHKLTEVEFEICNELMIYLSWLEVADNYIYTMKGGKKYEKR